MTKTPAAIGIEAAKQDDAERTYEAAYRAHKITTAKYRAMEIGDAEWQASRNALTIARDAHETFLFGGTDNACHN